MVNAIGSRFLLLALPLTQGYRTPLVYEPSIYPNIQCKKLMFYFIPTSISLEVFVAQAIVSKTLTMTCYDDHLLAVFRPQVWSERRRSIRYRYIPAWYLSLTTT